VSFPEILHKLRSRTWNELRLLPEALLLLGVMRLAVLCVSFQRIAAFLGLKQEASPSHILNPEQSGEVEKIGWSLRAMSVRTPWESTCLTQALAGMVMLQRRNIPVLLFLGVARAASGPESMAAHAWLKCGETIVSGEGGYERFTVISTFAGKHRR
jgi:hypothetical protein